MEERESVEKELRAKTIRSTLAELTRYVLPQGERKIKTRIILSLGCLLTAKLATVATPLLYGKVVDHISGSVIDLTTLWWLLGGYGLVRMGQEFFCELKQVIFAYVSQRAVRGAALHAFRHLHSLSASFHLNRQMGGMTRAIDRGAKGIDYLLSLTIFEILPIIVELVMVAAILWKLFGVSYSLVTTITVVAYIIFTLILAEWRMKFRKRMNDADEEAATQSIDSLLNFETVKYFNAEADEAKRYDQTLHLYEKAAVQWRTSVTLMNFGQGCIIAIGLVLVMGMAGKGINAKTLSVGNFVTINTYLLQLYLPLGFLGMVYREVRSSLADMGRMFGLLDEKPDVQDRPGASSLAVAGGEVKFHKVTFSYNGREVLRDVSFKLPAGRKVAIVGPSGAGKSTIARLLLRFYDPDSGTISIDDQDISTVTQESVHEAIGVVPQDAVLFNDTIGLNIAYGRRNASQKEIEAVARLASLDRLIDQLPDRYNTVVGERGLKLSGGEKQRIAIARAILKSPAILLLDEATSALDSRTEQEIQKAMDKASRSRTTLVIAHRLSTIVDADNIIVLANGQIIEEGKHNILLTKNGAYAGMWRRQLIDEESDQS